jgi:hypothetical protein
VDTSKLIPDQLYERRILLHTNSSPETHGLTLKVRTAPIQLDRFKISYPVLGLLLLTSGITAWGMKIAFFTVIGASYAALWGGILGGLLGAFVGNGSFIENRNRHKSLFGSMVGGILGAAIASSAAIFLAKFTGIAFGAFIGGMFGAFGVAVFADMSRTDGLRNKQLGKGFRTVFSLFTVGFGACLGIALTGGLANPLVLLALAGSGLPLANMLFYRHRQQRQLIAKYHQSQEVLIKP